MWSFQSDCSSSSCLYTRIIGEGKEEYIYIQYFMRRRMQVCKAVDSDLFLTSQESTVAEKSLLHAVSDIGHLVMLVLMIRPAGLPKKNIRFSLTDLNVFCVADKTSLYLYTSLCFCLELSPLISFGSL